MLGGGMDLTSSLEAKVGGNVQPSSPVRRKTWEVLLLQDAKVEKKFQIGVTSEIQRAKFGVVVTYIFGVKIWGSNKNFRNKFWAQASNILMWKYFPGLWVRHLFANA